jgi:chemotaxis protein MotB
VELHLEPRGLVVTLREAAFFNSGDDAVQRSAYPTIAKLAGVINKLPNAIRFEGHTDSVPISTARFRSNWELSAARGIAMLELFNTKYGVDRQRMAIVGYADTVALDSNKTEEGRARNRRVDIVIVSDMGMRVEPGQPAKPSPAPVPAGPETKDKRKEKA